jgi:serine/threonine-protein kinase
MRWWTALILAFAAVACVAVTLWRKRKPAPSAAKLVGAPDTADHMMGLALQGQGQLDMAFERFRRAPVSGAILDNLYALAHDFVTKNQPGQALAVYCYIAQHDADYKDVRQRLEQMGLPESKAPLSKAETLPELGRYQLEKELGKGSMGKVYRGRDPQLGRTVAIKTLALDHEFDATALVDVRERFFREAETAGRLQHPNIVTIYDAGETNGLAFIVMELLSGSDLTAHCKEGQLLPVPTALHIAAQVARALAYAHQHQVVHRDIKPANIMFDAQSGTVKVMDFGIARITDTSKTRTGLVLGTPSFMSPEQLSGKKVDGRSDLYSLGVTLFQLLTGTLPFRGANMAELMKKITTEEAPDIRTLRPELPEGLANLIALALTKRPELRYQSGSEMAQDLTALGTRFSTAGVPVLGAKSFTADDTMEKTLVLDARSGERSGRQSHS